MNLEEHTKAFLEMFPNPPNPDHHPKLFEAYVKTYRHMYCIKNGIKEVKDGNK